MPQRIQRRRARGWRMPEGAVYVGRPSQWGNPWRVVRHADGTYGVINNELRTWTTRRSESDARAEATDRYRQAVKGSSAQARALVELAGRDLVCWCPLDAPCHADVLLDIANT